LSAYKKRILYAKACPYREEVGDELEFFRDGEARLDQVEQQGGGHDSPAVHHGVVRLSYIRGGHASTFIFRIRNRKSENSEAHSAIANPENFVGVPIRKSAKFHELFANRKSANFHKILHYSVSRQS
jgi:hypothetical protein